MYFLSFILQDWTANINNPKGRFICLLFRVANFSNTKKIYRILFFPYNILYKILLEFIFGIEIPYRSTIGAGLKVYHGVGLVINSASIIGKNVTVRHGTTIGNLISNGNCPTIGNNVDVGCNVVIIGDINVGDNCIIGAGAIVVKNIPSRSVAVGNPAKVVRYIY